MAESFDMIFTADPAAQKRLAEDVAKGTAWGKAFRQIAASYPAEGYIALSVALVERRALEWAYPGGSSDWQLRSVGVGMLTEWVP